MRISTKSIADIELLAARSLVTISSRKWMILSTNSVTTLKRRYGVIASSQPNKLLFDQNKFQEMEKLT